ncbi:hypothetical protein pb186bvf_006069 [Paramecium bursaria]
MYLFRDIQRLRSIKRSLFYFIERYDYHSLQLTRDRMLQVVVQNKEDISKSAGAQQWVLYLKKRKQ